MKNVLLFAALASLLAACGPGSVIDSEVERGLVGAAVGYGAAKAIDGNGGQGAIVGGLAGVFCDDVGLCSRAY